MTESTTKTHSLRRYSHGGIAARALLVLTAAVMTLPATGCGGADSDEGAPTRSASVAMSIAVSNYPTTSVGQPYMVAREKGFFKEEGIEIKDISGSAGGGDTVRSVLAGDLPFGDVSPTAAAQAYLAGAPVVIIGGGVQSIADVSYVSLKDSPVKSINDLVGRSAGFTSPGSVTQALLELSLKRAGIDTSKVKTRAMGGLSEGLTALRGKAIDVAAAVEPVLSGDPDPYQVVWPSTKYVPKFQQTVIIASKEFLSEHPDVVKGFLSARAKAIDYIKQRPDETARIWGELADLDPAVAKSVIDQYIRHEQWGVGLTLDGLQAVDESMRLLKLVEPSEEIPWGDMINQDFLPEGTPKIDPSAIHQGT